MDTNNSQIQNSQIDSTPVSKSLVSWYRGFSTLYVDIFKIIEDIVSNNSISIPPKFRDIIQSYKLYDELKRQINEISMMDDISLIESDYFNVTLGAKIKYQMENTFVKTYLNASHYLSLFGTALVLNIFTDNYVWANSFFVDDFNPSYANIQTLSELKGHDPLLHDFRLLSDSLSNLGYTNFQVGYARVSNILMSREKEYHNRYKMHIGIMFTKLSDSDYDSLVYSYSTTKDNDVVNPTNTYSPIPLNYYETNKNGKISSSYKLNDKNNTKSSYYFVFLSEHNPLFNSIHQDLVKRRVLPISLCSSGLNSFILKQAINNRFLKSQKKQQNSNFKGPKVKREGLDIFSSMNFDEVVRLLLFYAVWCEFNQLPKEIQSFKGIIDCYIKEDQRYYVTEEKYKLNTYILILCNLKFINDYTFTDIGDEFTLKMLTQFEDLGPKPKIDKMRMLPYYKYLKINFDLESISALSFYDQYLSIDQIIQSNEEYRYSKDLDKKDKLIKDIEYLITQMTHKQICNFISRNKKLSIMKLFQVLTSTVQTKTPSELFKILSSTIFIPKSCSTLLSSIYDIRPSNQDEYIEAPDITKDFRNAFKMTLLGQVLINKSSSMYSYSKLNLIKEELEKIVYDGEVADKDQEDKKSISQSKAKIQVEEVKQNIEIKVIGEQNLQDAAIVDLSYIRIKLCPDFFTFLNNYQEMYVEQDVIDQNPEQHSNISDNLTAILNYFAALEDNNTGADARKEIESDLRTLMIRFNSSLEWFCNNITDALLRALLAEINKQDNTWYDKTKKKDTPTPDQMKDNKKETKKEKKQPKEEEYYDDYELDNYYGDDALDDFDNYDLEEEEDNELTPKDDKKKKKTKKKSKPGKKKKNKNSKGKKETKGNNNNSYSNNSGSDSDGGSNSGSSEEDDDDIQPMHEFKFSMALSLGKTISNYEKYFDFFSDSFKNTPIPKLIPDPQYNIQDLHKYYVDAEIVDADPSQITDTTTYWAYISEAVKMNSPDAMNSKLYSNLRVPSFDKDEAVRKALMTIATGNRFDNSNFSTQADNMKLWAFFYSFDVANLMVHSFNHKNLFIGTGSRFSYSGYLRGVIELFPDEMDGQININYNNGPCAIYYMTLNQWVDYKVGTLSWDSDLAYESEIVDIVEYNEFISYGSAFLRYLQHAPCPMAHVLFSQRVQNVWKTRIDGLASYGDLVNNYILQSHMNRIRIGGKRIQIYIVTNVPQPGIINIPDYIGDTLYQVQNIFDLGNQFISAEPWIFSNLTYVASMYTSSVENSIARYDFAGITKTLLGQITTGRNRSIARELDLGFIISNVFIRNINTYGEHGAAYFTTADAERLDFDRRQGLDFQSWTSCRYRQEQVTTLPNGSSVDGGWNPILKLQYSNITERILNFFQVKTYQEDASDIFSHSLFFSVARSCCSKLIGCFYTQLVNMIKYSHVSWNIIGTAKEVSENSLLAAKILGNYKLKTIRGTPGFVTLNFSNVIALAEDIFAVPRCNNIIDWLLYNSGYKSMPYLERMGASLSYGRPISSNDRTTYTHLIYKKDDLFKNEFFNLWDKLLLGQPSTAKLRYSFNLTNTVTNYNLKLPIFFFHTVDVTRLGYLGNFIVQTNNPVLTRIVVSNQAETYVLYYSFNDLMYSYKLKSMLNIQWYKNTAFDGNYRFLDSGISKEFKDSNIAQIYDETEANQIDNNIQASLDFFREGTKDPN